MRLKFFILTFLLLVSFIPLGNANSDDLITSEIISELPNSITPDQGDSFGNAIPLSFTQVTPEFEQAVTSGNLSPSSPSLFFRFDANQSTLVDISLNATQIPDTELVFLVYTEENADPIVEGFSETYPPQYPIVRSYPVPVTGTQYIEVVLFSDNTNIDPVEFDLTVTKFSEGNLGDNIKNKIFQSNYLKEIQAVNNYLANQGYINASTLSFNLKDYSPDVPNFAKSIASTIFGILRAGEFIVQSNPNIDATEKAEKFQDYLIMAEGLFQLFNNTHLHPTGNLFYEPSQSDASAPDYLVTMKSNVYGIMMMLELWNFFAHSDYSLTGNPATIRANAFLNQIFATINGINQTFFHDPAGTFIESVRIDSNVTLSIQGGSILNQTYLETMALFVEVMEGVQAANIDSGQNNPNINDVHAMIETNLVPFIESNLLNSSITSTSIKTGGIGVTSFDHTLGSKSDQVSLIGNAFVMSMYAPTVAYPYSNLTKASDIAYNTIKLFKQPNGLLVDQVNLASLETNSETTIISTNFFLTALDRLAEAWKFSPMESASIISRTYTKSVRTLFSAVKNVMFDNLTNSYFALYDHSTDFLIKDTSQMKSNDFIANTVILDYLSKAFPIRLNVEAQNRVPIFNEALFGIDVQQVKLNRSSWIWFQPVREFEIEVKVSSSDHNFEDSQIIDLFAIFQEGGSAFTPFVYDIKSRGSYSVDISLSVEGVELLKDAITLTSLGNIRIAFTESDFETITSDSEFSTSISFLDETGSAISGLRVRSIITTPDINFQVDNAYITQGRTDSSGLLSLTFDIENIEYDFSPLFFENDLEFVEMTLYVNVTNADSQNFQQFNIFIPLFVEINFLQIEAVSAIERTASSIFEFERTEETVSLDVETIDKSGNKITSKSQISWATAEELRTHRIQFDEDEFSTPIIDISSETMESTPHTFEFDIAELDAGTYFVKIEVENTDFVQEGEFITKFVRLIINPPGIFDSAVAAAFIFGGFILSRIGSIVLSFILLKAGLRMICPHCGAETASKPENCRHCGNPLKDKPVDNQSVKETSENKVSENEQTK